jgi:hypothetical protein
VGLFKFIGRQISSGVKKATAANPVTAALFPAKTTGERRPESSTPAGTVPPEVYASGPAGGGAQYGGPSAAHDGTGLSLSPSTIGLIIVVGMLFGIVFRKKF